MIKVIYFQRRPRPGFSFSLESIFEDLRNRLKHKIASRVVICKYYNDGYLTKALNIFFASKPRAAEVYHITGEVHFLNFFMKQRKVVLTILDCGMMVRKTGIAQKLIKLLYLTVPIAKSAVVTAISEETKKEIIQHTNCDPKKIIVIPVSVSPLYKPYPKTFNEERPNILHIGTGYNKNLNRLIRALKGLSCHLTIIGKLSDEHVAELEANGVEFSNEYDVAANRLLQKYVECDILSFISTFEGFGMPIVEANSVERVVITSNLSSMPEIAGNAACLVDPYSIEEIRSKLLYLISTGSYREELISNGRINKLRFNADVIADQYFGVYKEITGLNPTS